MNVRKKIRKLNSVQRKKVAARAAALIGEEMSLRELRKARKLTQTRVAKGRHLVSPHLPAADIGE